MNPIGNAVRLYTGGIPPIDVFGSHRGTPLVIDDAAQIAYYVNSAGAVVPLLSGGGGGGLLYWVEAKDVTNPPNGSISVSSFTPIPFGISATDGDAVIHPLGSGSLLARVPDNTGVGGNKRGSYSVDLQLSANTVDQIVAGNYSGWVAGSNNKQNTGNYAFGGGGLSNELTGTQSGQIAGASNLLSGAKSFIGAGESNTASGSHSGTFGYFNQAAADYAFHSGFFNTTAAGKIAPVVTGYFCSALTHYSSAGGAYANTRALIACRAFASLPPNGDGSGQWRDVCLYARTTTNAVVVATSNGGGAASAVNQICIPASFGMACRAMVVLMDAAGNTGRFYLDAGLKNIAGVVTLVGASTPSVYTGSAALAACLFTAVADAANQGISFNCTGIAATVIDWYVHVYCVEGLRP